MPPEESSLIAEVLKLVPVVTGALLAILGGAVTQYLVYRFNGKRKRAKLLREKAETLVQSLYEYSDWLTEKNNKLVFSKENHDVPSPLDKAWMIQKLYFPELREPLLSIMNAGNPMAIYCINQRSAQLADYNTWHKTYDSLPYTIMYGGYLNVFEEAIIKVSKIVKIHVES